MPHDFRKLDPREEHFRIAGPHRGLQLFLRRSGTARRGAQAHPGALCPRRHLPVGACRSRTASTATPGATPCARPASTSGASISTASASSDRYPAMDEPPEAHASLCRAADAARAGRGRRCASSSSIRPAQRCRSSPIPGARMPAGRFAGDASASGRPPRAVRPDRAPHASRATRSRPTAPAWRIVDARGPMDALHRGRAGGRAARSVARAFRRMGRALSRQRSRQPSARPRRREGPDRSVQGHPRSLARRARLRSRAGARARRDHPRRMGRASFPTRMRAGCSTP